MATEKPKLRDRDIQGLKYFTQLQPLLARLHEVGCERDKAGNRDLTMDRYCLLLLIWMFSPLVDSLRGLRSRRDARTLRRRPHRGRAER